MLARQSNIEFQDEAADTLLNPRVIFEVISKTTEAYDRGKKFDHYRQIPSLSAYVLVSQSEPLVERCLRQSDGAWQLTVLKGLHAVLQMESLPLMLSVIDIYFKVAFDAAQAT